MSSTKKERKKPEPIQLSFSFTEDNSEIIKKASDEAIARVLADIGLHLEGEAAEELENDPRHVDTGRLKGSIVYVTADSQGKVRDPATDADGEPAEIPEKGVLAVGTNVEYGIYVHEGTKRMDANHFLKNAFDRNMSQIEQRILDELKNG